MTADNKAMSAEPPTARFEWKMQSRRPGYRNRYVCARMSLTIRYGELLDVIGRPADREGMKFAPARVNIPDSTGSIEQHFRDHPGFNAATQIPYYDVAFVRARIPRLFGYTPQPAEFEKTFLDDGFVAVLSSSEGVPFLCSDYYGRTGLIFSERAPENTKALIASGFWSLILESPDDVESFEAVVHEYGCNPRVTLSCRYGEVYADEE